MPQTTYLTVEQGRALAQAVINLSNGLLMVDRDGYATAVISTATAYADHVLRHEPRPAPAPSCDSPHCACADGTDCPANAATEEQPAWTLNRVDCPNVGDVFRLSDGREVIQHMIPAGTGFDDMRDALHVLSDRLHKQPSGPDWHLREAIGQRHLLADVAAAVTVQGDRTREILDGLVAQNAKLDANTAKLEGLCKAVDALAERLERKPASSTKGDPEVKAAPLALLPEQFHTSGVIGAAFRLQRALGIQASTTSSAAVEAFRQGHVRAWQRRDRNRATYEETDHHVIRRAAEDLIGHLNLITEGVDWASVDRFKEIAEG